MIRILLLDDHAILRSGLRMILASQSDMEVVAEGEDAASAGRLVEETSPDLAIVDLDMPGGGVKAVGDILRRSPGTRVLVLTIHDDVAYLRASLAAGAAGYLTKSAADTDLLAAIRTVHQGRVYVDVSLQDSAHPAPPQPRDDVPAADKLSRREHQVLELVALGYTQREIAERIHLSIKTVETYRSRIADKLELRSRAQLVRYALENGILTAAADPPDSDSQP